MVETHVKPERDDQASEPTPDIGELRIWQDGSNDSWMLYRDDDQGNVRVETD